MLKKNKIRVLWRDPLIGFLPIQMCAIISMKSLSLFKLGRLLNWGYIFMLAQTNTA